jgi:hypothetical protein
VYNTQIKNLLLYYEFQHDIVEDFLFLLFIDS